MKKLRTAVIGAGSLGQHHVRILSQHPLSELVAVVDTDAKRREKLRAQYRVEVFETHSDALARSQAAVIAVPTPLHFEIAKDLIAAGVHCLVEKPFTSTLKQAGELIALARDKNLVLQVGHVERFNPAVIAAQPYIERPKFIEVNRLGPYDPRTNHIGVVMDLMIHDLDILLTLVKEKVVSLEAHGAKVLSAHEDIAKVRLKFSNGCVADLSASRISIDKYRKIRIFQPGSHIYLSIDYAGKSLKIFRRRKETANTLSDIEILKPKIKEQEPLFYELDHFLNCVSQGKKPVVSGEHGRDALELALEIAKNIQF